MNPTFDPNDLLHSGLHMQPGVAAVLAIFTALVFVRPWKK